MTDLAPFTLDRLSESFRRAGYNYQFSDDHLIGTWNDVLFQFSASPDAPWLMVETQWMVPDEIESIDPLLVLSTLQGVSNEWNRSHLQPTAYPDTHEDKWLIQLDMAIYFEAPCSDEQIDAVVGRALDVHLQAHEVLGSLFAPVL